MIKLAINGFGRIGRNAFKIAFERHDIKIVAINDLTDTKTLAHLLKHDSTYGTYDREVKFDDQNIIVDGEKIRVFSEKEPKDLPWSKLQIDVVIESTGFFTDPQKAAKHLDAGAKKVVISLSKLSVICILTLKFVQSLLRSSIPMKLFHHFIALRIVTKKLFL